MSSASASASQKVALVVGASSGVGKGICIGLAKHGWRVYCAARTLHSSPERPNSLEATVKEIESLNTSGSAVAVQCDITDDGQVQAMFDRVLGETNRIDLYVHSPYAAVEALMDNMRVKFWEQPAEMWDTVNNTGLRSYWTCGRLAARHMVSRKQGLIINITSMGGLVYLFNVAYGAGKAAVNKLSWDMAQELKEQNVACVALSPGPVFTEKIQAASKRSDFGSSITKAFKEGESAEFSGHCIDALFKDKNLMSMSGKFLMTGDLSHRYNIPDTNGQLVSYPFSFKSLLGRAGFSNVARFVPQFLRFPKWVFAIFNNKM